MADDDGVDEVLQATLRVALTIAGRLAEAAAREQERLSRAAMLSSEREAQQMRDRLAAERQAARAQLAPLRHEAWWGQARSEDIALMAQTAATWQRVDPEAAAAVAVIRHEVRQRFGVELTLDGANPGSVRAVLDAAQHPSVSSGERTRTEAATAAHLLAVGERDAPGSGPRFDSPERRAQMAERLAEVAEPALVTARVLADTFEGRPPAEALGDPALRQSVGRIDAGPAAARVKTEPSVGR